MVNDRPQWFDDWENPPPFVRALNEVRQLSTREGWCYHHVQAVQVAIDQYAEAAHGNREFFLNRPYSIGPTGTKDVP
ncbi:hypothetical protein H8B02_05265 [Bradyrhizobium sp. Pear77]|uniref:hypothetical protein n=1 Tax=Bradyrhizobium altum TaxID=1571202 RepID=UPI001E637591|nr:hypothetical protein [Bradyrhizobium altum]MCC8952893.1 hypothetical protein [Bradyrhizobium altum]